MTTTVIRKAATLLTDADRCELREVECAELAMHRYRSEETGKSVDLCESHSLIHGPALDELEFRIVAWRE